MQDEIGTEMKFEPSMECDPLALMEFMAGGEVVTLTDEQHAFVLEAACGIHSLY